MKRIAIVLAVAASAVGLAGCGGDDGDVAETTEPAVTTTAPTETETAVRDRDHRRDHPREAKADDGHYPRRRRRTAGRHRAPEGEEG